MAELPEISKYSKQMDATLKGKNIVDACFLQEKNLNIDAELFKSMIVGESVEKVAYKGKWFILKLTNGKNILISLGRGADILYFEKGENEQKYQVKITFSGKDFFTIRFWWFGKFLYVPENDLLKEPNTSKIGIEPFNKDFTFLHFCNILNGKKTQVKSFLLDQKNIGGIGNMYIHDILFLSKIHPKRAVSTLTEEEKHSLYKNIIFVLSDAEERGTYFYEKDFFGNPGPLSINDFLVGYKKDQPCPNCNTPIEFIKTGSTSSYICPSCPKENC